MVLYGRIEVTDLSGQKWDVGSENRGWSLRLREGEAAELRLFVNDPTGLYKQRYELGSRLEAFCESSNPPMKKAFMGVIERVATSWDGARRTLVIDATEYFYVRLMSRLVTEVFHERYAGDIVKELFQTYAPEFDTTQVQSTDTLVREVVFNYNTLKECLDTLCNIANAQYYCTPELQVHFYQRGTLDSRVVIEEADVYPITEPVEQLVGLYNVVYVVGGWLTALDQRQEVATSHRSLHDVYLAVKFEPRERILKQLALYLEKLGSPEEDLMGAVVEDRNGLPTGPEVRYFTIRRGDVGSKGWYLTTCEAELDTAKAYWIRVDRRGDESNTYLWYHNASATDSHAESQDGVSWSLVTSSWMPAFRQYTGAPVIARAVDPASISKYGEREYVFVEPSILRKDSAKRIARTILSASSRVQRRIHRLRVKGLSSIPQLSRRIRVRLRELGIDDYYVIKGARAEFPAGYECIDEVELELA